MPSCHHKTYILEETVEHWDFCSLYIANVDFAVHNFQVNYNNVNGDIVKNL